MNRREFILSAGAFVTLQLRADETPLWSAGIVTDTHVFGERKSCRYVKMACDLFAERNVDLFIHCGDIADRHIPEAYPILRELTDAAFPAKPPRKIWVYANHDRIDRRGEAWETVMSDVRRLLGDTHGFHDLIDFRGWPILVFPQEIDVKRAEAMLTDACARFPGKPVFVVDHVSPIFTTDNTATWGNYARKRLYSRFPRAIVINGHVHTSLRNERNIWQGEFTCVNAGCLQVWQGHAVGAAPESKRSYGALVMEVFADRVVFRRFDVRTKAEYAPEEAWTVPLPFDPATAPYRPDVRGAREVVPQFPAGAVLSLKANTPFSALEMAFPPAESAHGTYIYKVQVTTPEGESLSRADFFGHFYLPEGERDVVVVRRLSAGYFDAGRRYRVRVTPCNCFGGEGRPLEAEFAAPTVTEEAIVTFESADPAKVCPFFDWRTGGKRITPGPDGWFDGVDAEINRFELPAEAWKGEAGTRFRFTVDLQTEQTSARTWTLWLGNLVPLVSACARVATPEGKSGRTRYVVEFAKKSAQHAYHLFVGEGERGRLRFDHVKIERLGRP